jgi:hypothetical protein
MKNIERGREIRRYIGEEDRTKLKDNALENRKDEVNYRKNILNNKLSQVQIMQLKNQDAFEHKHLKYLLHNTFNQQQKCFISELLLSKKKKKQTNKLHDQSPRANYTDRATAACWRSDCQLLRIEGATWSA